ncbi:hypothetical protein BLD25_01860 [Candidatus Gracilibacteria bacterium GN02-872]|nr:hypothetical protein BLD25_01860 [Candidatus Gracilibacteria bacterium GN02-872]
MNFDNYYKRNKSLFGSNPLEIIKIAEKFLNKEHIIVDLGCGQGRNLIYLLNKGFNIYGIDISEVSISDLKVNFPEYKNNFLKKNILDLDSYDFSDLISTFTFNFIDKQIKFIFDLKEKSKFGSIHVISDFLEKKDIPKGFLKSGQINEIYKDWEILYYNEAEINTIFGEKWPCYNIIARKNYE